MEYVGVLIWDNWNVDHIARHHVTPLEVEEVCQGDPLVSKTYKERLRVIGPTNQGRMLTVILAPQAEGTYYPVTARPARSGEGRLFREEKGEPQT